jgi:hypothetical protein
LQSKGQVGLLAVFELKLLRTPAECIVVLGKAERQRKGGSLARNDNAAQRGKAPAGAYGVRLPYALITFVDESQSLGNREGRT